MRAVSATWLDRAALGLLILAAASVGFELLEPSVGLTADLRLTNLRLLAALVIVAWLLWRAATGCWPRIPRQIAWITLAWIALLVSSAALAPISQTQALAFVRDMSFGIVFGWAVYDVVRSVPNLTLVARAFALGGMGVAVIGLAEAANVPQVVAALAGFRNQASFGVGDLPRIASTLPHPNIAAMLLGLTLPLQVAWIATARRRWLWVLLGLGAASTIAALVLTVSRAGMLVSEIVLCGMLLIGLRRRHGSLVTTSLAGALLLPLCVGLVALRDPLLRLHLSSASETAWYSATYSTPATISANPGGTDTVPVTVQNTGDRTWEAGGPHPFALSYHLEDATGNSVNYDGPRTALPLDVAPGASIELQAQVVAPPSDGNYVIVWDGVQEAVTWFSWVGTPVARTSLRVSGPPPGVDSGSDALVTRPPATLQPPPPGRLAQWRIALRMARNRPLLGVGPDNFRWVYGYFAELKTWDTGSHANSLYFEWLADTGVVGLALYLWLSWQLLRAGFRHLAIADPTSPLWIVRVGLAASLVAWYLHGALDYFYEPLPTTLAFWLVAGLVLAADTQRAACASPST